MGDSYFHLAGFMTGTHRRPPNKFQQRFQKKDIKSLGGKDKQSRPEGSTEKRADRRPGGNFGKSFGRGLEGSGRRHGDRKDSSSRFSKSHSGGQRGEGSTGRGRDDFSRNKQGRSADNRGSFKRAKTSR